MIEFVYGYKVRVQGKTLKVVCDDIQEALDTIMQELNVSVAEVESVNPWYEKIYVSPTAHKSERRKAKETRCVKA